MTKSISKSTFMDLEKVYSIIKRPVVSEKSTSLSQFNQYVFDVDKHATKLDIKKSIETIFNVKVNFVNTLNRPGKQKRFRGRLGVTKGFKRAIVCVEKGQTIDVRGELL